MSPELPAEARRWFTKLPAQAAKTQMVDSFTMSKQPGRKTPLPWLGAV